MTATVVAVARRDGHGVGKTLVPTIDLIAGQGVAGDAHCGATVKHRSRVRADPSQPNLRQVHLIPEEVIEELAGRGFPVAPGAMGENVTTRGIDLLALPRGARVAFPSGATLEITGLRNPCTQLDEIAPGLMDATLDHAEDGSLIRRAGVMAVVLTGGAVAPGDAMHVELPAPPHEELERV